MVLTLTATATAIAAPAWAINLPFFGSCKSQPVPEAPGTGVAGYLEVKPSPLPATAQAFGPTATSTEFVQYGYAGLHWAMYDMGCVPQRARRVMPGLRSLEPQRAGTAPPAWY